MTTAPLNACATRSLHAYSAYGPVTPKPVIATTVNAPPFREQLVAVDAPIGEAAEAGCLDHEIDTVEQLDERRGGGGRHLDDGTPLVGVQVGEHPCVRTERVAVGWFHLHHVGAEIGEGLAAPTRGNTGSDLDDPQVAQYLSHDVLSSIRSLRRARPVPTTSSRRERLLPGCARPTQAQESQW